jgi:hypothetical protein
MKRRLGIGISLAAVLAMAVAAPAWAATFLLLDAVGTTGPGVVATSAYDDFKDWSCDVIATGSPTTVVIRIDGNQGGDLFGPYGMATHTFSPAELAAGIAQFSIGGMPAKRIRANLITLTGGANPTITVRCTGVK